MAEKMTLYGRVNGQVKFTYGPKQFNADWGGAFTALEIANLLTKLPKANIGKRTPMKIRRVGNAAGKVNLQLWMKRLEIILLSLYLDALMISATKVNLLWPNKIHPSKLIRFSGNSQQPSKLVGEALCEMRLNYWGIVKELTLAMLEFDDRTTTGNRSVSAFFTI